MVVPPLDMLENAEKRNLKPLPTLKKYSTLTGKETNITVPVHLKGLIDEIVPSKHFDLKENISETLQQFQVLLESFFCNLLDCWKRE